MVDESEIFLQKAVESLAGAESEFANGRYNNCANRCYYACFQAAIQALVRVGIQPGPDEWAHAFVQARFAGDLISRRKLFPANLRDVLARNLFLREMADYKQASVSGVQALRAVRRTREFVGAVRAKGGEGR